MVTKTVKTEAVIELQSGIVAIEAYLHFEREPNDRIFFLQI
jgi:hypothetical protein